MVIGDLNYDIMIPEKSHALDDLCDILGGYGFFSKKKYSDSQCC
jgi:hypothetical protein